MKALYLKSYSRRLKNEDSCYRGALKDIYPKAHEVLRREGREEGATGVGGRLGSGEGAGVATVQVMERVKVKRPGASGGPSVALGALSRRTSK